MIEIINIITFLKRDLALQKEFIKVSKFLSYILRHNPEKYGIQLDSKGYTDLDNILSLLNSKFLTLKIDRTFLSKLINASNKIRFELNENMIRAYYGHSIQKKIHFPELKYPPNILYHGTTKQNSIKIFQEGLKSKGRQYVHLSDNIHIAKQVAKRRTNIPIILEIDVQKALDKGIKFYKSGDMYLSDGIPPDCIKEI